jgi:acyl-CoA synthetase (AMP-forming)/AMP-acid ligase II
MTTFTSPEHAITHLLESEPEFALEQIEIRGVSYRVFKNAPSHVGDLLTLISDDVLDEDFLVYNETRVTFAQFKSQVNQVADSLVNQLGVQAGDRVAIALRNCPEYLIIVMALASIGAVIVYINSYWTEDELHFGLKDSGTQYLFLSPSIANKTKPFKDALSLTEIIVGAEQEAADGASSDQVSFQQLVDGGSSDYRSGVEVDPDSDYAIMYTSGSSGKPKGVVLTHRGAISAIFSWRFSRAVGELMDVFAPMPLDESGRAVRATTLITTPLFHVSALHAGSLLSMIGGGKLIFMSKWDRYEAVRLIESEHVTRMLGVPTMSMDVLAAAEEMGESLSTIRFMDSGGAKRPASQVKLISDKLPMAAPSSGFGMTETNGLGMGITGQEYVDNPESAGRFFPPLQEGKIVDDFGHEVKHGEAGELYVKSPANMREYLGLPQVTAETLIDGWLATGDIAVMDETGMITIIDRKKDIIIRGGENISCLEVDSVLHQHPDVIEAAVFSMPDERLGEVVAASVYLREGTSVAQEHIQAFVAERVAAYKVPEKIWFADTELPRGATEKIDRKQIRKQCLTQLIEVA